MPIEPENTSIPNGAKNNQVVARMLYDQEKDPDENTNISELPEKRKLVGQLSKKLATQIAFTTAN